MLNESARSKLRLFWKIFILILFATEMIWLFYSHYRLYILINDTFRAVSAKVVGPERETRRFYAFPGEPIPIVLPKSVERGAYLDESGPKAPSPCSRHVTGAHQIIGDPDDEKSFDDETPFDPSLYRDFTPALDLFFVRVVLLSLLPQYQIGCGL